MPTRVNNQAVKLYDESETRFNQKTSFCEWHEDYFQVANCDDTAQIILNNLVFIDNTGVDSEFDNVFSGSKTNGS